MTRYCWGPVCRDLRPVRGPRSLYCAECSYAVRREKSRGYDSKRLARPEVREQHRASNRTYIAARRAAGRAA